MPSETAMNEALIQLQMLFEGANAKEFVAYKRIDNNGGQGAKVIHPDPQSLAGLARALTDASETHPDSNFFVRVTPIARPPTTPESQGLDEDATGAGVIWCDVDTVRSGSTKEAAYAAIMACIPGHTPSLVIDTGGGLHAYWRLAEWTTDLVSVRGACAAVADRLRHVGGDPAVKNAGRVMRLAGTYNRKPGRENALATIIHYDERARLALAHAPQLPVSAENKVTLHMKETTLPPDYLPRLRALGRRGKMVADRIESELSAIAAGAATNEHGSLDRSANDYYIGSELWRIGRNALHSDDEIAAEIYAVFSNPAWVAGDKGNERDDYWERTIYRTMYATAPAPDTMYDKRGRVLIDKMAEWLADEGGVCFVGIRDNAVPYLYNHLTGVYEEDTTNALMDHIRVALETRNGSTLAERESIYKVLRSRQDVPHRRVQVDDPGPLLVVRNGVLNVESGELREHTPVHIGFRHVPTDFRSEKDIPEYALQRVDEFVARVIPDEDDRRVWWQYVGYILHRGYFTRGIFYLIGPHGAGKSALLELLANCLGPNNFSHVTPTQMSSDFGLAPLLNALANVSAEAGVNHSTATIETMKALSGGDAVSINRKNKDRVEEKLHVPMLFSANDTPRFSSAGATEALRSRLLIVSSGPTVPAGAVVPDFGIKLSNDPAIRSAFLSRALDGLQDLMRLGTFSRTMAMETRTKQIIEESDRIRQFLSDLDWVRITGDRADSVLKVDLYTQYRTWLATHDPTAREESSVVFQNRIRSLAIEGVLRGVEDRDERQNGRGRNVWSGLQIEEHEQVGARGFSGGFVIKR
ncbi:MAG TPA: phage/plasmid primase, P4 family [Gemmatimonadaceae bacterium]|jgi:P4 family phage/plasmid primase-like protien